LEGHGKGEVEVWGVIVVRWGGSRAGEEVGRVGEVGEGAEVKEVTPVDEEEG